MKNKDIYSPEELELFAAVESGNYSTMPAEKLEKQKEVYAEVAKNTIHKMTKKKGYHLRLMEHDVENIKILALQKGLPYQTLISSIIHQVATKQIKV
jgi:predicted DNA binding CopG/RHH family protein